MANDRPSQGSTPVGMLSESLEDYLEIVLQLQREKRVARVRDIASRKGVSNASVSNALARLARDGFVRHEAHEYVELTERGEELAGRVLRRHEFLVAFLRDVLQVSPDTAESDACALEHHVSMETLERMASFYQFARSCPKAGKGVLETFASCCSSSKAGHKDKECEDCGLESGGKRVKCATSEGELVALSALRSGEQGVVVRLTAPLATRERLADAGLLPNVMVEVARSGGKEIRVSVQGYLMDMDHREATSVLVRRK